MRDILMTCLAVLSLSAAIPLEAWGAAAEVALRTTEDAEPGEAEVRQAESYLQGLGTAKARFLQTSPNGSQLLGTFYLNRPGKLRFEYDDVKDFIVADGLFVYFYDSELGEQSNAPIGQTLADFLLRSNLKLGGDVTVTEVARAGGLLRIKLVQSADPQAGSLTLGFSESPFALKKWRVVDATGAITEVELYDLQRDVALPSSLFVYRAPAKGKTYNQ